MTDPISAQIHRAAAFAAGLRLAFPPDDTDARDGLRFFTDHLSMIADEAAKMEEPKPADPATMSAALLSAGWHVYDPKTLAEVRAILGALGINVPEGRPYAIELRRLLAL